MPTICDVRVCQPITANSPDDWRTSIGQILVAIETSDGTIGYGVGGGGLAGMHVIESVLKGLLLDQESEPVEEHWSRLSRAVLPFGPEGIAMMALSGVDLALWDLRGKCEQKTVAQLLNPKVHLLQTIPTYQTVWETVPPEVAAATTGVKLHLGASASSTLSQTAFVAALANQVQQAREAIGEHRPLMVDAWMTWDLKTTLKFASRVEAFNLEWIEEPLPLTDLNGYETLFQECPIPIAGGEHIFTAHNFRSIIDRRLHTILQPDICWVGGMTEMVKIYALAREANLRVIPHRGAELWGLHTIAALDNQPLAESGRPWMSWVGGQPKIIDGTIQLPERPGFGVEFAPSLFHAPTTKRL